MSTILKVVAICAAIVFCTIIAGVTLIPGQPVIAQENYGCKWVAHMGGERLLYSEYYECYTKAGWLDCWLAGHSNGAACVKR